MRLSRDEDVEPGLCGSWRGCVRESGWTVSRSSEDDDRIGTVQPTKERERTRKRIAAWVVDMNGRPAKRRKECWRIGPPT
jgi:hypothetical protein